MARRKARRVSRGPRARSLWALGAGYLSLTALTKMATGLGPWEFLTKEFNLGGEQ